MMSLRRSNPPDKGAAALNREWFSVQSQAEFVEGAPHLKHAILRDLCAQLARQALQNIATNRTPVSILDMGAGDGTLTIPYLQMGASVVAADVTVEFLASLQEKSNAYRQSLTIIAGDIFETVRNLARNRQTFDLVCSSAFLHHIPNYLDLCREACRLIPKGGVFFNFQDPLRYDTLGWASRLVERFGYFWWRGFQGNYLRGLKTRWRRTFGVYRNDLAEDTAEYHVVRNGVDHLAMQRLLESEGFECEVHRYWSTQSALFQRWGQRLNLVTNFAMIAKKSSHPKNGAQPAA